MRSGIHIRTEQLPRALNSTQAYYTHCSCTTQTDKQTRTHTHTQSPMRITRQLLHSLHMHIEPSSRTIQFHFHHVDVWILNRALSLPLVLATLHQPEYLPIHPVWLWFWSVVGVRMQNAYGRYIRIPVHKKNRRIMLVHWWPTHPPAPAPARPHPIHSYMWYWN